MDAFSKEALSRLPLAEVVMRCWQWALDGPSLQRIFDRHRGRSYESVLKFETIVNLMAEALLEHQGSGNQAFERAADADELEASKEAAYGKLRRIPISLSDGFLQAGTQRISELLPRRSARTSPVPKSLRHMEVLFVDGKKLKHVPRLLKAARGAKALILGGKTISALSWNTGLVKAIHAHPDGETSDAPLVPGLLSQLNEDVDGERLFVEDRQFCDLVQPPQLTARKGDHFLIRYNAKVHFFRDQSKKLRHGIDEAGNRFVEEWGWLGKPDNPRRFYVRRITLNRPATAEGKMPEPLILITDLLDADKYPAEDLLLAYRSRWGIETVFQKITDVFHLKNLISTTPEGTVFQFAFCMLLYNVIQLVTQYLAEAENIPVATISQENVFNDVHRQLIAWNELISPALTASDLTPIPTAAQLRDRLKYLLSDVWTDRWLKAPPKKRKTPHHDTAHIPGAHVSMYRLIHGIPAPKKPARRERK
jgi:hypothetical protein